MRPPCHAQSEGLKPFALRCPAGLAGAFPPEAWQGPILIKLSRGKDFEDARIAYGGLELEGARIASGGLELEGARIPPGDTRF